MAYAQAGCVVEEVLSSIKTVIAFNGQDKEAKRYCKNVIVLHVLHFANSISQTVVSDCM